MAQKKLLSLLICIVLLPAITYGVEDRFEFKQEDLDWANSLAKISQKQSLLAIKKKWQQLQKLTGQKSDDDTDLSIDVSENEEDTTLFRVFISESMGIELLKNYVAQARKYQVPLILRGLPENSWHKLSDFIYAITDGDEENVLIQIDDEAFREFNINSVPSFVLAREVGVFANEEARSRVHDKLSGNVGIRRALEIIEQDGLLRNDALQILDQANIAR